MKILFISHDASLSGAPISLKIIIDYINQNTEWDIRILSRRGGPLLDKYREIANTKQFYKHLLPGEKGRNYNRFSVKVAEIISAFLLKSNFKILLKKNKFYKFKLYQRYYSFKSTMLHFFYVFRLKRYYRKWNPDLIYSNTALNGDIIRELKLDAPIIVHVRELQMSFDTLNDYQTKTFIEDPFHYFAVSEAVKNYIIKQFSINENMITKVPVAIELNRIIDESGNIPIEMIHKELNIDKNAIIIGSVGAVHYRKGCDFFIQIAEKIINEKKFPYFIWIGDGNIRKQIIDDLNKKGLSKRIQFIGRRHDVYPYINAFDIILMTSRDDPFPRINLEGGALKKPIIAFTESGGSKEFIENDCGYLIKEFNVNEMIDKTIRLIDDQNTRKTFGNNGFDKVKNNYDKDIIGAFILNFIRKHIRNE